MASGIEILNHIAEGRLAAALDVQQKIMVINDFVQRARVLVMREKQKSEKTRLAELNDVRARVIRLCQKNSIDDATARSLLPKTATDSPSDETPKQALKSGPKYTLSTMEVIQFLLAKDVRGGNTRNELIEKMIRLSEENPYFLESAMNSTSTQTRRLFACLRMRYPEINDILNKQARKVAG